jgi:DnaJ-class molecular chaperone
MNEYNAAVLARISDSNSSLAPNKNLLSSTLKLPCSQALPVEIETEVSRPEATYGTKRTFSINDMFVCHDCINLKPIGRRQCANCIGVGYVQVSRKVSVNLPKDLIEGQRISYAGLGRHDYHFDKNCDLIVRVKITE